MIPSDSKNAHAAPGFASGAAAVVRPGEPGAEERPYRRPDEEDPRRNGSAGPDGYGSKEVEGLNLSKANMKKLFLLVAGGVVLNALLQHLDLVGYFLYVVLGMIAPFLAGSAIAFIINVPMRQIEMRLFPELPEGRKPGRLRRAKRVVCRRSLSAARPATPRAAAAPPRQPGERPPPKRRFAIWSVLTAQ